jgi:polyisoprenoid-binding protein YceI/mono/diheme cytochrome c family protein
LKTILTSTGLILVGLGALLLEAPSASAAASRFILARTPSPEVIFTVDAPLDSITGLSRAVTGSAFFDLETLDLSSSRIVADPRSFQTGISLRDEDLRDQFFEADHWPEIVLAVQKLSRFSRNGLADGERVQADAQALFTVHGVTRSVTFPVELERHDIGGKTSLGVHGAFQVALADYQIRRPTRLFLKLGEVAQVRFDATFVRQSTEGAGAALAEAPPHTAQPSADTGPSFGAPKRVAQRGPPVVARLPHRTAHKGPTQPSFEFAFNTPEGRGERLYYDATIGGPGNALSCASCHSTADERLGFLQTGGTVRPAHSLYNGAQRPSFWQGFSSNAGNAGSFCARMFMLLPKGFDAGQQRDLQAFLLKISPDPAPGLDYQALILARRSELTNPLKGDPKAGAKLTHRYCESCHAEGAMRPALTPGLYEADYLVKRVRWQQGHDSRQMPPMSIDRLTDSELRDIITYLVGDESQRIFKRNRAARADATPVRTAPH